MNIKAEYIWGAVIVTAIVVVLYLVPQKDECAEWAQQFKPKAQNALYAECRSEMDYR
jgi:hypothetical protein